jgi:gamma-glutamyltranspeptidase / glutathione hydrolase
VESANGEDMGGFQAIWFLPAPPSAAAPGAAPAGAAPAGAAAEQPVAGVYRAASDHRKDGEAVGW